MYICAIEQVARYLDSHSNRAIISAATSDKYKHKLSHCLITVFFSSMTIPFFSSPRLYYLRRCYSNLKWHTDLHVWESREKRDAARIAPGADGFIYRKCLNTSLSIHKPFYLPLTPCEASSILSLVCVYCTV